MTRDMMKTYMTKIFTVLMLMMVSMGAKAEVEVKIESFTGGKITASQGDEKNGEVEVTLTVAPDDGYTISKKDIEVYATISPNGTRADNPEVSGKLELKGDDPSDLSEKRNYTVTVKSNFGLWVKKAEFISGSKGNRGGVITITTDTNENSTIEDNEKILYLIQSNQFESFYMVPTSDEANATTNNIPNDQMLWYFLDAGIDGTTQYYYIVSNSTNKYICHAGGTSSGTRGVTLVDKNASNEERCKFKLVEDNSNGTVGFYNIDVKGNPTYYGLNKQGGSSNFSNPVRLTNTQYIHDPSSKWKFIPYNGTFTWPDPPFTPSTTDQNYYYKIHNKTNESYYVSSDASSPKNVTISSTESDNMVWYFKEADNSDPWIKYYYIVNPVAGEYMYYKGTATNGSNQDNAIFQKAKTSENEDRFQFIIVQTARVVKINNVDTPVEGCYTIIPKLLKDQYWSSNSISPTSISEGNKLGIRNGRGSDTNNAHWEFESTVYPSSCSTPTITYSSETGKITITSTPADAEIHYTIDGETEPSSSVGTLYSVPFEVSSSVTIKAIATKTGYDPSTVETVSFIQVATPSIQNNGSNAVSITCDTEGATIYYTTDGSTPTTSSTEYTEAFENHVSGVTIKAIAVKDGMINSAIGEETFTLNCATPTISFNSATSQVTISGQTGTTIYYTTDGNTPTTSSTAYSVPFTVSSGATIKAIAIQAGYSPSTVAELAITQVATPSIQNNGSNAVSITCATEGATIYYTTDGSTPTPSSNEYTVPLTENVSNVTIKAIAVKENMITSEVGSGSVTLQCESPVIVRSGNNGFTVSCPFPTSGVTIYYITGDGSQADPTTSSSSVASGGTVTVEQLPITVMAMAVATNYDNSTVTTTTVTQGMGGDGSAANPYTIEYQGDVVDFITTANTDEGASKYYKVIATSPLDFRGASAITQSFSGTFDGGLQTISGLGHALFNTINGGTVKNVILDNVDISSGDNVGAICNEASGATRIYNCGILGGSVGGSNYVGGLVGLLNGTARVINCYSYATITDGTDVGGIVGYNDGTTTAASINTMVMNCMFYGDITGGTTVSPVYGGNIIDNRNSGGLNNFNYYAYDKTTVFNELTEGDNKKYNCSLAMEEKYLNRFEFYRQLLNSNKKLAAIYASTASTTVTPSDMAKWVLETADRQISNPMPYPILKRQGYYPSIINIDAENAPDSARVGRNMGGKLGKTLEVNINIGSGYPEGAAIKSGKSQITLVRTDKDEARFNFNYDKVQLPYYNDVGTKNYTGNKVVTGWKITAIDAVAGDPYTSSNYPTTGVKDYPDHNYADRKSSKKDLYSVSGRVFSQGAYFDVPYGVTSITIEPYWGNAAYVADEYLDVVCKKNTSGRNNYDAQSVTQLGKNFSSGKITINDSEQNVNTSISDALGTLSGSTVYDNAVVLVGNLHQIGSPSGDDKPFTLMSVDLDEDNEPDNSLIMCNNDRNTISPIRFDFLNIIGMAHAQKPHDTDVILNVAIYRTKGWFETTNSALIYFLQFEYENTGTKDDPNKITKTDAPLILQGGYIDQFVSAQSAPILGKTTYIHVGSNVLINSFGVGTHSDGGYGTPHIPVSVTGGDYNGFYLTGTYNANAEINDDNAECYISGGRFGELAGAAQEQIGSTNSANNGNVRWQIYNADITDFFGGGINDDKPIQGNIITEIYNSHVGTFCGGPKFGNMAPKKKVTTTAEGCTFNKFFGAGFGGNSYSRKKYYDKTSYANDWTTIDNYFTTDRGKYFDGKTTNAVSSQYGKKGPGVATDFDYEFFPWTSGSVGLRYFVKFVSFSLAECNDVESTLNNCIINENFYGGGNLGKVKGTATSSLENCTVKGNVYGAGYSATLPGIKVRRGSFSKHPSFNPSSGMLEPGVPASPIADDLTETDDYTWKHADNYPNNNSAGFMKDDGTYSISNSKYIVTTVDITKTNLGSVGSVDLTIKGTTTVGGSVYGGGEESAVGGNTEVNVTGGTVDGNVYGGGNLGSVGTYKNSSDMKNFYWTDTPLANINPDNSETFPYNNTGVCNVTISGGTIGKGVDPSADGTYANGNVFGAGKGVEDTWWCEKAIVYTTNVTITDGTINGTVYGGGQVGRVEYNSVVTIGTENASEGTSKPNIRGNVFGAGAGLYTHGYSALVRGDATVTVQGVAQVGGSVYGGGEIASVGRFTVVGGLPKHPDSGGTCTVTIQDKAKIGTSGTTHHVFGACKGVDPSTITERKSMQLYENRPKNGVEDTDWSYYTTYPQEYDGQKFVWVYYSEADYPAFLKTLALTSHPHVTIDENATVYGSVFGGGQRGISLGHVDVDITGGTIYQDVYGGGALADTNVGNMDLDSYEKVEGLTADISPVKGLYTRSGSGTESSPYIYTIVSDGNPTPTAAGDTDYYRKGVWTHDEKSAWYPTHVSLTGGRITGDAYGGGLGQKEYGTKGQAGYVSPIEAQVYGDVLVELNGKTTTTNSTTTTTQVADDAKGCIVNRVFGCNNLNGTPKGKVQVYVYATQKDGAATLNTKATKNTNSYDVQAVYGGGNLAPYIPHEATLNDDETNTARTEVYIDGCDLTSIKQVYGGGNAAPAPATYVEINRAYEIDEVFGGGNGADNYSLQEGAETKWYENPGANVGYYTYASYPKTGDGAGAGTQESPWTAVEIDKFSGGSEHKDNRLSTEDPDAIALRYGSGIATLLVKGGTIHTSYGGSNSKGNVRKQLSSTYSAMFDDCPMSVATTYGGGKNAYSDADAEVSADCAKGVREMFGGATAADFDGDINLRITNGSSLERVFGGNNTSGAVKGSITVTIEEGGCEPIRIGSLYLGGYLAPYSVYGYNADKSPKESGDQLYKDPRIIVISATRIDNIFGGGYQAKLVGNPHINVNMKPGRVLASYVDANTFVGEHKDANNNVIYVGKEIEEGTGDGILETGTIGNIYGGGNLADVIGNTFVEIGTGQWHNQDNALETTSTDGKTYTYNKTTQKWVDTEDAANIKDAVPAPARYTAKITGDVFGGGNEAHVSGNTNVYIGAREKATGVWESVAEATESVTIDGTKPATGFGRGVFGGGNQGHVYGDSYVYMGGGTVNQTIYGGGCEADVKGNTNVTMLDGYVFDGVCGGGLAGSVGTVTSRSALPTGHSHGVGETCVGGKPDGFEDGTGTCTVVITGGQVGPVEVATEGMTRRNSENGLYEPVSEGWVWGASRGVVVDPTSDPDSDFKTYVNSTDVTIGGTAFILEGVIGGGEFGHVRGNTLVKIQDECQIGVGAGQTETVDGVKKPKRYSEEQWTAAATAVREGNAADINDAAAAMPACSHFPYGREENGQTVYDTYDPYADKYDHPYAGGSTSKASDGKTWIGCVFGGGSGFMPYENKEGDGYNWDPVAGLVEGDSEVRITGGHILSCVYGGNEVTSVLGQSKVTMTGGTIGVPRKRDELNTNPMIGNLYGAGKGDPRTEFNGLTNVGSAEVEISGGIVFGSVYGGSEDGHVEGNSEVKIKKNADSSKPDPIIGTWGASYVDGNVYGGGMGVTTNILAGLVKGNTKVDISDGIILHNIYGGGAYGSVGEFNYDATTGLPTGRKENTTGGTATIEITGGTIGTNGNENGMVFGSSRGDVDYDYTNNIDPNDRLAWVYSTDVKIGNSGQGATLTTPLVYGSVYGSGENGHTWQNTVINIYSGTIGTVSKDDKYMLTAGGVTYTGADYPYRGNVYGGGCGTDKYASTAGGSKNTYNPLAGIVRGTTTVNISGGQVAHNVYGAGAMGSVGGSTDEGAGKTTINITGGRIGDDGDGDGNIYGAARGDTDYTGANRDNVAQVRETDVNINYATAVVTSDNENHTAQLITGSVFGGGEAGVVTGDVAVDMTKGLVLHDVYGGGALANSNTANWDPAANSGAGGWAAGHYTAPTASTPAVTEYKTNVTLTGGMINGNVYGGGLGRKYQEAVPYQAAQGTYGQEGYVPEVEQQDAIEGIPAKVYGDVTVKLNETTDTDDCVVKGNIFGCNNLNGSPQNQVSVYVYKTQGWDGHTRTVPGKLDSETESDHVYDVEAVYGGGNLAAYEPYNARKDASETEKAQTYAKVEVYGCDLTSIRQVYGGGNAASSPATSVTINSAYEIEEVFGGGNGYGFLPDGTKNPGANVGYEAYPEAYDPPASTAEYRTTNYGYGSGKASVNIYNGRVHRVFGGSNTKGNVRVTAVTILEKNEYESCSFVIDEAYGGGKSAPMDAEAKLLMSCIPGLKEVYGGAQDADIINNVVLNISNGTFDRVFGGNNKSGSIKGTITVNIEETGCKPVIIGQLYGGGNLAAYTGPFKEGSTTERQGPTVNVKAFTSIGEIYGGGFGAGADVTGDTYVNINEVILSKDETHQSEDYSIKPFIDTDHPDNEYENVELSDGTKYKLWYRPVKKDADTQIPIPAMGVIGNVFGGGNEAEVIGSTHVNIGNKATETIVTLNNQSKPVKGVDIRGDVYGGGNKANVTGNTNVKVGKE